MTHEAIAWDRASFEKLWEAAKLASEAGADSFTVDLGRKKGRHKFGTIHAIGLCNTLQQAFAKPKRIYPENREGPEPK